MAHTELDLRERRLIEDMLVAKASVACIARRLSRQRSTVYREISRNRFNDDELAELSGYSCRAQWLLWCADPEEGRGAPPAAAQADPDAGSPRRRRRSAEGRLVARAIAGRLRLEGSVAYVCHETIYAHVYSKDGQGQSLAR